MTELQLQAIVNQQGIEGTGESNLDMTIVNGVSVSKWHLDSVTYGKKVSDTLKESVKKYLQQFVGSERVFPTQQWTYHLDSKTFVGHLAHYLRESHVLFCRKAE